MITRFNHSGFVVKDLNIMVEFYTKILGLEIMKQADTVAPREGDHTGISDAHRQLVFLGKKGEAHLLELVHFVSPPSPDGHLERYQLGSSHICMEVDDLRSFHKRLSGFGEVKFVTPPKFSKQNDGSENGVCYMKDPEGNYIELVELGLS